MYSLIFAGVGLLLALIFVGVGALNGRKQHRTYSWMRLVATALALVLAIFLSGLLARGISVGALKLLTKIGLLDSVVGALADAPVLTEVIGALIAMILAPMIFYWFFLIVKGILNFIVRRVARSVIVKKQKPEEDVSETKTSETIDLGNGVKIIDTVTVTETKVKKEKKFAVLRAKKADGIGALCGAVCGLLLFFAFMLPWMGTIAMADKVMNTVGVLSSNKTVETIESITDSAANNMGAQIFRKAGGDFAFEQLTTQKLEGEAICLVKEVNFLSSAAETVVTVMDSKTTPADASKELLAMEESFDKTALIPTLVPSVLSSANQKWDQGEAFMGVKKPLASNTTASAMVDPLLHGFADADAKTVREDVKTVIEMMAILAENDALKNIKTNATKIVNDEELTASLLCEVFENKHMCTMVGAIADGGLGLAGQKIGVDLGKVHLHMENIENAEVEAAAMAHALHCSSDLFRAFKQNGSMDADMLRTLGPMMDAFSHTALIGEDNTTELMRSLLSSEKVSGQLGFSAAETDALVDTMTKNSAEGYTAMMDTVGQSLEVVQLATQATKDPAKLDEKVGELIAKMTPASAEVLKAVTTPNLMVTKGVPTHSAEATSDMLTSMFDNLSVAKEAGMSEEEYQQEAAATTNMLNMAMSAKASGSKELFGEGSATGKSAESFVEEIFASDVISQTMVETVYAKEDSSEPTINPLGTKRALKENEKTDILAALNNQWANASEEQRADEAYQKQYVAMGAMMNLPIEFTENGIVDSASLTEQLPNSGTVTE